MKSIVRGLAVVMVLTIAAGPVFADTLVLKNGTKVTGYFEGGTARVVKFRGDDGAAKDYDILQIQEVIFDAAPTPPTAPPPAASNTPSNTPSTTPSTPQLRPGSERPPANPPSTTAANTGYTVPTGTKIIVQLVDAINSETSKAGSTFVATLDEPIVLNGMEIASRGADIRGRITTANDAGRVAGSAELGLELTQLYINGIPYAMTTSEYSEVGQSRTGQTVKRAGIGAGAGAVIGAIVGGGKGAAIGAGVGAGAGTASQVLTKGEKLNIPAETKLEFTLRSPLVIAAR
jgi:YMGG-like Gly-zipper